MTLLNQHDDLRDRITPATEDDFRAQNSWIHWYSISEKMMATKADLQKILWEDQFQKYFTQQMIFDLFMQTQTNPPTWKVEDQESRQQREKSRIWITANSLSEQKKLPIFFQLCIEKNWSLRQISDILSALAWEIFYNISAKYSSAIDHEKTIQLLKTAEFNALNLFSIPNLYRNIEQIIDILKKNTTSWTGREIEILKHTVLFQNQYLPVGNTIWDQQQIHLARQYAIDQKTVSSLMSLLKRQAYTYDPKTNKLSIHGSHQERIFQYLFNTVTNNTKKPDMKAIHKTTNICIKHWILDVEDQINTYIINELYRFYTKQKTPRIHSAYLKNLPDAASRTYVYLLYTYANSIASNYTSPQHKQDRQSHLPNLHPEKSTEKWNQWIPPISIHNIVYNITKNFRPIFDEDIPSWEQTVQLIDLIKFYISILEIVWTQDQYISDVIWTLQAYIPKKRIADVSISDPITTLTERCTILESKKIKKK